MIGRRVETIQDIELAGDYCGPIIWYTGDLPAVFFLLPTHGSQGYRPSIHGTRVAATPRGGSNVAPVVLRDPDHSIGAMPFWHGYLDEGHVWRGVEQWANS